MNRKLVLEKAANVHVAALSDAADEVGLTQVCMDSGIMPLTLNKRLVGFARTGKNIRSAVRKPFDEVNLETFMRAATEAQRDDILVLNSGGVMDCAVWGSVITTISVASGIRGAVLDGATRDLDGINKVGFTVFGRGCHPASSRARLDMESIGKPIVCGGVPVSSGDLVCCDSDGVVVIPQGKIEEVLKAAEESMNADKWWFKKLEEGRNPIELHREKLFP